MDMRTTISVYGSPEYELARVASAEMARFYGLPIWGNAGMSDSLALDEQAAADAAFSILVAQLTGTHLAHDVGYLEAGLMTSPEMIVLCAEMISQIRQFAQGVQLNAEQLALDVIHAVGPGGSFLAEEHTLRHFREAWQPALFGRYRMADWVRHGSKGLDASGYGTARSPGWKATSPCRCLMACCARSAPSSASRRWRRQPDGKKRAAAERSHRVRDHARSTRPR